MQSTENSSSDFDFKCMKANIKIFLRSDYKENKQKRNHALLVILFIFFKRFLT